MARTKIVNGERVALTAEEEALRDAEEAAWESTGKIEAAWRTVRNERNTLISETDWWASSDLTITDEQRAYRQALRDVPSQSDPFNITWPTKP
tara:strand:- start:132 stop:410 length:279 start_codon:yes stop_codon:yes gene_type:complete